MSKDMLRLSALLALVMSSLVAGPAQSATTPGAPSEAVRTAPDRVSRVRRIRAIVAVAVSALLLSLLTPQAAFGARLNWPSGWTNPAGAVQWEDWNYDTCGYAVVNGESAAHLGTDSQGYKSGPVLSIGTGTVKRSTGNRGINSILHVEYNSTTGPFTLIYQHVIPSVGVGTAVGPGTQVGTVADWGGNSHVHVSLIPGSYTSGTSGYGYRGCSTGAGANQGHVNPIPWLAANGPASTIPAEGSFVSYQGHVYRVAGGAPIYLSSWDAIGGSQPTRALSDAEWALLRQYPSDGAFIVGSGTVYRVVGGAPIAVGSWDAIGGSGGQPVTPVDQAAIDRAGQGGIWDHLRQTPADGAFIVSGADGSVYRFAGGAPVYVSSWEAVGGAQSTTTVDQAALSRAGEAGVWSHIRSYPTDGTYVRVASGRVYRVVGGTALHLKSWEAVGGEQPSTLIDEAAISKAGGEGRWRFLRANPVDGSSIVTQPSGKFFRFESGAWFATTSQPNAVTIADSSDYPTVITGPSPTIEGQAAVGSTLIATAGSWQPAPITLAYQWLRNGAVIAGAGTSSYTTVSADAGTSVSVRITGSRDGLVAVSKTSAPVAVLASAGTGLNITRLAGSDRQGTAVEISKSTFAPGVPVTYIATGAKFPDALSAAPAAATQGGPLLLVDRDTMSQSVKDELNRLKPRKIVVVGSDLSVSDALLEQLRRYAGSGGIHRIGGVDRYDTANRIVEYAFSSGSGKAWVATGEKFPDALSASAAAGSVDAPVLLVNGGLSAATAQTRQLVSDLGVTSITIAGSALSVSEGIKRSLPVATTRIGGSDRYDTSEKLNKAAFSTADTVYFATGENFPDALAGATAAGYTGSPLFAVRPDCVPRKVLDDIRDLGASKVVLLGGSGTLSDNVARLAAC